MMEITHNKQQDPRRLETFYTPVFILPPDDTPPGDPNYVVFTSAAFVARNAHQATIMGMNAVLCGYTAAFGLTWDQEWAVIEKDAGPFIFFTLSLPDGSVPKIRAAIIHGPILNQAIANGEVSFGDYGIGST